MILLFDVTYYHSLKNMEIIFSLLNGDLSIVGLSLFSYECGRHDATQERVLATTMIE
jgi:hypothetical protein